MNLTIPNLVNSIVFLIMFVAKPNVTAHTVTGVVYDNFLDPIENVSVKAGTKEVKTDVDGNFTITTEEPLPLKIVFSKEGYEAKNITVTTESDKEIEIVLEEL